MRCLPASGSSGAKLRTNHSGETTLNSCFKSVLAIVGFCGTLAAASAPAGLDAYFGVGTMTGDSTGASIDTFGTGQTYPANTAEFFNTPRLTGAFGKVGATFQFSQHFGVGAETSWRFSQGDYAGLNYRPTFWDVYGVYRPTNRFKRVVPELLGGLGGVNVKFFDPQSYCNAFTGCSTSSTFIDSANHFQVRMGAGLALYATPHIFFRPQVDAHYINNFSQFGTNWVPEYSVAIGYRFGER
jgi:hypothetical protein